tara:strand:- start:14314 stop:16617 length:2304 start_codon:yes stop_codon:yes gene_type:complete
MFRLLIQLYIERLLSGGQPYLASHPELGVPLGIFNRKDEPNHQSRVNSILKQGKEGNKLSTKLAKMFGINMPLPSYAEGPSEKDLKLYKQVYLEQKKISDLTQQQKTEYEKIYPLQKKLTKEVSGQIELQTASNLLLGKSKVFYDDIGTMISTNADGTDKMNALLRLSNSALEKEGQIRKTVVKNLGMQGQMQTTYQKNIASATIEASEYGIDFEETLRAVSTLSEVIGRNLSIDDDTMAKLAIFADATELGADATARLVQGFDKMGVGVDAALEKGMEMRDVAQGMGLNVGKFMKTVAENMSMVNAYNFKDGVQGFTRMAAQAQRLGLSMQSVKGLMDKVIDPEGAIDLAANLQVIGGAVGDLADPFKLMYMATSDLEGLQNAIVKAGESAITFNEETGEMGISPTEMRRMRAMAEQLGMGYEEYVGSVKMAKQETLAMSQMNLGAFAGSEDAEQLKQFAASMSQFKDGKYKIELEPGKFTALEDLQDTQVELLRESMKGDAERAQELDASSEKEIMFRSMTALEAIQAQATKGQLGFEMELGSQGQALAEATIGMLQAPLVDVLQDGLKAGAVTIREVLKEVILPGAGSESSVNAAYGEVATGLETQFQSTFGSKWQDYLNAAIGFFSQSEPTPVQDYFTQGVTDISNSAGSVRTKSTDIIAAFDGTKINSALPSGGIATADMDSFGRQIKGQGAQQPTTSTVKVDVNLGGTATLNASGLNMNIDAKQLLDKNLVLMWLKDKLEETSLDGKPGYKTLQKAGGVVS